MQEAGVGSAKAERRSAHEHAVEEALASPGQHEWARYEPRMQRVINHVHDHLDEPLDLNAMAELACLSPHHWHRIYHAMYGETLAHTVKRLRLHRAAGQLACSNAAVAEVAKPASDLKVLPMKSAAAAAPASQRRSPVAA